MTYIGIACIIIAVVGSVHFVYKNAFAHGHYVGIGVGRLQILEEDVKRTTRNNDIPAPMLQIVNQLTEEADNGVYRRTHSDGDSQGV